MVSIVAICLAANDDPYSRGNISFHEQTLRTRFVQDKTLHHQSKPNMESLSLQASNRLPGETIVLPNPPNKKSDGNKSPRIKFFWGIMSTLSGEDKIRRSVIRQTYLSYYKQSKTTNTPHRICSLTAYRSNTIPRDECEMIYAFVVGGAKDATKDLVDEAPDRRPLELKPPSDEEDDLVYLNIHENAFEGKMQSYFKWVTALVADNTISVDYIAKVDSDTILFPHRWFSFTESFLLPAPYNRHIYGGIPSDRLDCGGLRKWHCREMVGPNYMSGELYFLSTDMAEFIVSDRLGVAKRKSNEYFTEDLTIGNFVHLYRDGPILQVVITDKHALWEHGDKLKDPRDYVRRWEEVKGTWRLNSSLPETVDTSMEGHDGIDDNVIASYKQFSVDRWRPRAILDELYHELVNPITGRFIPRWNLP